MSSSADERSDAGDSTLERSADWMSWLALLSDLSRVRLLRLVEREELGVGEMGRARFTATFPEIFKGTHVDSPDVEQARARRIDFVDPVRQDAMVDGEILNLTPRSIEVLPGALEVVA